MTPVDRFINNFRDRGTLFYTTIVFVSTGYVFYLIGTVPEVPPEPKVRPGKGQSHMGRDTTGDNSQKQHQQH